MRQPLKVPVVIDNDTQEVLGRPKSWKSDQGKFTLEITSGSEFASNFAEALDCTTNFAEPMFANNLVYSSDKIVQHFTESLCILLGCKNGGLADKAPKGKKVYLAQAEHLNVDHAVKLLHKQLKTQVSFRRKTVRFTEVNIQHKFNYRVKVKLYLEN